MLSSIHLRPSNAPVRLLWLVLFGGAFGYVEASVVYYLRIILHFHTVYTLPAYHVLLNLGFIAFVSPVHDGILGGQLGNVEVAREVATIIMLVAVAYIAGRNWRQRLGALMVGFACWDIMYYAFLRLLDGWPQSLATLDIYFLVPVTWIGPVITPLVISIGLLAAGAMLYLSYAPQKSAPPEASTR